MACCYPYLPYQLAPNPPPRFCSWCGSSAEYRLCVQCGLCCGCCRCPPPAPPPPCPSPYPVYTMYSRLLDLGPKCCRPSSAAPPSCCGPRFKRVHRCGQSLIPGYRGHIPGFKFHGAGRTFGNATRDTRCVMSKWEDSCCPYLPARIWEQ